MEALQASIAAEADPPLREEPDPEWLDYETHGNEVTKSPPTDETLLFEDYVINLRNHYQWIPTDVQVDNGTKNSLQSILGRHF